MDTEIHDLGHAHVRSYVGGKGAPLVYLHGFEQHPGAAPFLEKLAETRRVLAPEHPGFGESGGFAGLVDILDLALHYRAWLETVVGDQGPVDLIGHSLGGMFAAEIAAICPDLVRRLVLVDAYGLWLDDHPQPDPFVLPQAELDAAKWADPAQAGNETNSFDGPSQNYVYYRSQNLGAASRFMWPLPDRGLARRLKYLRAPTLVIHGAQDGLVPPVYAQVWADAIKGAKFEILDGAGHLPMVEAETAFIDAVRTFLD